MARPRPIPLALTKLIAREELIEVVEDRLEHTRLVTVVGAGGAGKTRLAVELAARRQQRTDGVFFVELAPVEERWVGSAFAEAVASDEPGSPVDIAAAIDALREAGTTALIVADNCEHVLNSAREVIEQMLARCPGLRVLATSRVKLGVTGEAVIRVEALACPPAQSEATARDVGRYASVELLVDRATLHDPNFMLDDVNAGDVAEICRIVDGLPLAVELAAAQLRGMSPRETVARMRRDLLVLPSGDEGRRATLEQVLRWSYDLLDAQAQELLCRLSVFHGGFTLEAAEHVCASPSLPAPAVYGALFRLLDHSLVERFGASPRTRYRLFDAVRTFGHELLDAEGSTPVTHALAVKTYVLTREGDVWAVGRPDELHRLKHAKGIEYLHRLIQSAGQEVHALALASDANGATESEAADAGLSVNPPAESAVVDEQALRAYRRRYADLQAILEEASELGDARREADARREVAFLADELARVAGRGGRSRLTVGAAERARVAVTKAIRAAIGRIERTDTELGAHLAASVTTGQFCSYDPRQQVVWRTR